MASAPAAAPPRDEYAVVNTCTRTGRPIRLCYNTFGSAQHPCILLVMGIFSHGMMWTDALCAGLAASGPYYVVRFDNRDSGLSTHLGEEEDNNNEPSASGASVSSKGSSGQLDNPDVVDLLGGGGGGGGGKKPPVIGGNGSVFSEKNYLKFVYAALQPGRRVLEERYTLEDMAADALGLLTVLHVTSAHLVGFSVGGIIAQYMAIAAPQRVRSLTLISTHTSNLKVTKWPSLRDMVSFAMYIPRTSTAAKYVPKIAAAKTEAARAALTQQRDAERAANYAKAVSRVLDRLAGDKRHYKHFDAVRAEAVMNQVFLRSLDLAGATRQFVAFLNSPKRDDLISKTFTSERGAAGGDSTVYIPTVVIQGTSDVLNPEVNSRHVAKVIQGSELVVVRGMGHMLIPPETDGHLIECIRRCVVRGEEAHAARGTPQSAGKLLAKL